MAQPPRLVTPRLGELDEAAEAPGSEDRRESQRFVDLDLTGQNLQGATFEACELVAPRARETTWRAVHLARSRIIQADFTHLEAIESSWRTVEWSTSRVGSLVSYDSLWRSVRLVGCRLGYLNLRGATLTDVAFEDCTIDEIDLGGAQATRLSLAGSRIGTLDVPHARLADVDLSGGAIGAINGLAGLRGATISATQLWELAPHLAAHLGIEIAD